MESEKLLAAPLNVNAKEDRGNNEDSAKNETDKLHFHKDSASKEKLLEKFDYDNPSDSEDSEDKVWHIETAPRRANKKEVDIIRFPLESETRQTQLQCSQRSSRI